MIAHFLGELIVSERAFQETPTPRRSMVDLARLSHYSTTEWVTLKFANEHCSRMGRNI